MYFDGDLPQRSDCGRNAGDLFALAAESLEFSPDPGSERLALQQLSAWEEARELGLESYGSSSDGTLLWDHFISTTYHCLSVIAPMLDTLTSEVKDRVESEVVPVAVDRVTLCSLEERIGFVEAVAKSRFLANLPVPPITAELLPGDRVGDFVVRRVFCTHSIDQTFGNDLALLAEGLVHLQQLFDKFQPRKGVTSIFEECLLRFGQIKFRQWNDAKLRLDESQLRLLRVFSSLLEQLDKLDTFLLRTSDSLVALFERLDPDGTGLINDPEWSSLLLSMHRLTPGQNTHGYLSQIKVNRAKLLLEASSGSDIVNRLQELYASVRAGIFANEHHKHIHEFLALAAPELPKHSLSTYRDWLVLAASTKFGERNILASVTLNISSLDNSVVEKSDGEVAKRLLLESTGALTDLMSVFEELNLQRSAQNAIASICRLVGKNSMPVEQGELHQLLRLLLNDSLCTDLPFNAEALKNILPPDKSTWSDEAVDLLFKVYRRFDISRSVTEHWFLQRFPGSQDMRDLSDRSITRLLIIAEPHLNSRSGLVKEAYNRCFADIGRKRELQLLRRTCLVHADLGVKPNPQSLRMIAATLNQDPTTVQQEQAQKKIPALFALLWWVHTAQTDPELVADGCLWIQKTCLMDQVKWSPRDRVRWQRIQEVGGSTASSTLSR